MRSATKELEVVRGDMRQVRARINEQKTQAASQQIEIPPLYAFVKAAWSVIEPSRPFVDGKHIKAICLHLEALFFGKITRLLVNMPPRFAKSSIISVLFRVWCWLKQPGLRFLCASYALSLAIRDNLKCRRLILSPWFQEHYRARFRLSRSQKAKIKFENDQRGVSQAVSVGSSVTGEGFDIGIIDDAHAINDKKSRVSREGTIEWFADTWCTRMNDPATSKMVVVGQRVHVDDLSGFILSGATGERWVHLNLAAEYEPDSRCITHTDDGQFLWEDWRTLEGELLWQERFPHEVLDRAKKRGILVYAALFQQNPVPPGGFVFNKSYERLFEISPQGDLYLLITPGGIKPVPIDSCWELTTSDVAVKDKEKNDFTVFAHWAVTPDLDVLLLDLKRGHWSIPKQKEQARLAYYTWLSPRYWGFFFEDVGYQSAIGQDLLLEGIPCLPFHPEGDKVYRAGGASIWQETGKLYFLKGALWLGDYQGEIYTFPLASNDDQVDPTSMVCIIVRSPELRPMDQATAQAIAQYVAGRR